MYAYVSVSIICISMYSACIGILSVCMAWIFTKHATKSPKSIMERRDQAGWTQYNVGHEPISFCRYSETMTLTDFGAPALKTRVGGGQSTSLSQ